MLSDAPTVAKMSPAGREAAAMCGKSLRATIAPESGCTMKTGPEDQSNCRRLKANALALLAGCPAVLDCQESLR